MDIEKRVLDYWTVRAHDFGIVRRNEIRDGVSARWGAELDSLLPGSGLRILDVGILPCCWAQKGTMSLA